MQILNVRPEPPGSGTIIAHFDADVSPDLRLLDMCLRRTSVGDLAVFPAKGRRTNTTSAIVSPALRKRLLSAALSKINGGQRPDDRTCD